MEYKKTDASDIEIQLASRFKDGFITLNQIPHPHKFKDMERAAKRIVKAIHNNESITVVSDFDIDGTHAVSQLKMFFSEIGYPLTTICPHRVIDGYGLSMNLMSRLADANLVITVDNGISSVEAAEELHKRGIDLIITDHHMLPPVVPRAYAIVNQKQKDCTFPYDEVCGAQIAWYLIAALKIELDIEVDMLKYLEFASIAIVGDVMPLQSGINRAMLKVGLERLAVSNVPAFRAYREYAEKTTLTSQDIGYFFGPILNSAGRMEDANYTINFLMSDNIQDARVRLLRLVGFNDRRKEIEAEIAKEAIASADESDSLIMVKGKGWHEGVIGIVASRVARHFKRPAIVFSENDKGMLKGSGRNYGEGDLFEVVSESRDLTEKMGGHKEAVGLSIKTENFDRFKEAVNDRYKNKGHKKELIDKEILGELTIPQIDFPLVHMMKVYEPFGQGNTTPKFISKEVTVHEVDTMGKKKEHLRFSFSQGGRLIKGVKFRTDEVFSEGDVVDITYTINENHFRGDVTLQLMVDKISNKNG